MIFVSYFLPISFLLLALLTFHIKESRFVIDPSSALIAIWLVVFVLHGTAYGLGLVVLYHSDLLPNMLVTFGVLLFSIAFRTSRRFFEASSGQTRPFGSASSGVQKVLRGNASGAFLRQGTILLYVLIVLYLIYAQAQSIVGSNDVFGQLQLLRTRVNYENFEWGLVEYGGLSAMVAAVYLGAQSSGKTLRRSLLPILVFTVAIGIAVISSQRTTVLMTIIGFVVARSVSKSPSVKAIALSVVGFFGLFVLLGFLLGKVGTAESDAFLVIQSGFQSFSLYLLSPLSAFSSSEIWGGTVSQTQFTTRFFYRVFEAFGLYDGKIQNLVLDFAYVPIPTNVYTFVHASISDFGYGYLAYFAFVGVVYGYVFSLRRESPFVCTIQALLYYPIATSFFQDQWMTIASQWVQIAISAWVLHVLYNMGARARGQQRFTGNGASSRLPIHD